MFTFLVSDGNRFPKYNECSEKITASLFLLALQSGAQAWPGALMGDTENAPIVVRQHLCWGGLLFVLRIKTR